MAIPFADILQDWDLPAHSLGVYTHFNDIVFYAPSERIRTERVKDRDLPVCSLGVYTHFNDIVFYAPYERIRTERAKELRHHVITSHISLLVDKFHCVCFS
jgi:hypothetical protein